MSPLANKVAEYLMLAAGFLYAMAMLLVILATVSLPVVLVLALLKWLFQ